MITNRSTTANAASLVISANPSVLYGLTAYSSKASAQFIQLHDAASLPANGAVPKVVVTVAATSNVGIDYGELGRQFSTGIVVCNSSTQATLTIGSDDCWFDAQVDAARR